MASPNQLAPGASSLHQSAARVDTGSFGNAVVYHLHGEIDSSTVPDVRRALCEVARQPQAVIDLSGVTFIDPAGLGLLAAIAHRRSGGRQRVLLVGVRPTLARAFEAAGMAGLCHPVEAASELFAEWSVAPTSLGDASADPPCRYSQDRPPPPKGAICR